MLSAAERGFFQDVRPWGFILFGRNIENPDQIRALVAALRESLDRLSGYSAPTEEAVAQEEVPAAESSAIPAEPEKIGFSCPECGKFFEGPATLAGTAYKCPECHVAFHIH